MKHPFYVEHVSVPSQRTLKDLKDIVQRELMYELQPEQELFTRLQQTDELFSVGQVAQILGYALKELFAFLRRQGVLMTDNRPYRDYQRRGLLVERRSGYERNGILMVKSRTFVTGRGVLFIREMAQEACLKRPKNIQNMIRDAKWRMQLATIKPEILDV